MANIELPKDAEGREIPLDTEVLYDEDGNAKEVQRYTYSVHQSIPERMWEAVMLDSRCFCVSDLYIAPPDSWAKLEEDMDRCIEKSSPCMYFSSEGDCSKCARPDSNTCGCTASVFKDIERRVRKLRGEN